VSLNDRRHSNGVHVLALSGQPSPDPNDSDLSIAFHHLIYLLSHPMDLLLCMYRPRIYLSLSSYLVTVSVQSSLRVNFNLVLYRIIVTCTTRALYVHAMPFEI
jgi:hypothetical protein